MSEILNEKPALFDADFFFDAKEKILAGFDEAGRGPLAGPVCAACVILPKRFPVEILSDSKKLSEKKRLAAESEIKEKALWGASSVSHKKIDEINILQASLLAMERAFFDLLLRAKNFSEEKFFEMGLSKNEISEEKIFGIADGKFFPKVPICGKAVVKADSKIPQVMAASIIAKTFRDRIMKAFDALYPGYGYKKHKGYPTADHKAACRLLGPSPIQRLSFKY